MIINYEVEKNNRIVEMFKDQVKEIVEKAYPKILLTCGKYIKSNHVIFSPDCPSIQVRVRDTSICHESRDLTAQSQIGNRSTDTEFYRWYKSDLNAVIITLFVDKDSRRVIDWFAAHLEPIRKSKLYEKYDDKPKDNLSEWFNYIPFMDLLMYDCIIDYDMPTLKEKIDIYINTYNIGKNRVNNKNRCIKKNFKKDKNTNPL